VDPADDRQGQLMRAALDARERERKNSWRADAQHEQRQKGLGFLVKRMREEAVMSQGELAERIGSTQSSVSRWESGNQFPSLHSLNVIAQATGFDLLIGARGKGEQIDGLPMRRMIDPDLLILGYVLDEGAMAELWLVANSKI
jgi:transcriptional regulator with XRE-family HTH domain